jgi:hypothetical protein
MKKYWWVVFPIIFTLSAAGYYYVRKTKAISSQQAMEIALKSEEVQAFMAADHGRFASCAERRVVRPCDSDWVTCIDDAWVVEFFVGKSCGVEHDGRLNLHLVVDWKGNIVSRFPEKGYYQNPQYCIQDLECMSVFRPMGNVCKNFVYGQIDGAKPQSEGPCQCVNQTCGM